MGGEIYDLQGNTALYEVLGVTKDASDKDIRKAYYRLAVVYHPDKNPGGEDIFKEVTFAYNILSDPEQRAMYDRQSLKNHLQGRATEYNPEMDPNVELGPEDLRRFVEKIRQQQESKKKQLSDFEARREEEMKRRAEYDARNPEFKREYERQRELRQRGAASQQARAAQARGEAAAAGGSRQLAVPSALTFRTSAEMMKNLQEEENRRMMGERISSPTRRSNRLSNIKETMMSQYRGRDDNSRALTTTSGRSRDLTNRNVPDFVRQHHQVSAYSATVDETIEKFANYDYLDVVVNDKNDKVAMDGAILADALTQYDRNN